MILFIFASLLCQLFSVTFFMAFGFFPAEQYRTEEAAGKGKAHHAQYSRGLEVGALHDKAYGEQSGHQYCGGEQGRVYHSPGPGPAKGSPGAGCGKETESRAHISHGGFPQAYFGEDEAGYAQQYQGRHGPGGKGGEYGPGLPGLQFNVRQQKNTPVK